MIADKDCLRDRLPTVAQILSAGSASSDPRRLVAVTAQHILPDEYFEAAAEAGVLVSAEFPMIYGAATGTCPAPIGANSTGCDATLTDAWTATVKRLRNFPSVFDYTMDNEDIK